MRFVAFLIGAAVVLAAPAAHGEAVLLNQAAVVDDAYVRLGDLFANAGAKSDTKVARAPAPGQRAVFDARWLYRVARAYGLEWRPLGAQDRIVIERDSQAIDREEIEAHILAALREKGADRDTRIELSNQLLTLYVAAGQPATMQVDNAVLDVRSGRFSALVSAPAGDPTAQRVRVSGRIHRITEVPVLARRMAAGDVIGKNDVKMATVRADRLQHDTIVDPEGLVGMAVRRFLQPDLPVRTSEVQRPLLVAKGSLVTLLLRTPYMTLTAQGKAQDNGAEGDAIRVTNTQSNQTVEAVVIGANVVAVRPASRVLTN
jgi:flagella basal body P-ring formation protein FlgA